MKKYLILLCLGLFLTLTASAQKFALVDMEYIMSNIPAYERANEQLNQTSKKWQAEVEAMDNEAKTLYKNYQNEAMFLSEEQKKEREEAIVNKEKLRSGGRALQEARLPHPAHPGRNLQRRQEHCPEQGLPARHGPRLVGRHHLRLAGHRHQQRGPRQARLFQLKSLSLPPPRPLLPAAPPPGRHP